jgi:hypothetical protein
MVATARTSCCHFLLRNCKYGVPDLAHFQHTSLAVTNPTSRLPTMRELALSFTATVPRVGCDGLIS